MDYTRMNGELRHHGIKGQQWGRRRYQYQDGSLTPAGRARYDDGSPKSSSRSTSDLYNKNIHTLNDQELYAAYGRLTLEQSVSTLNAGMISKGEQKVNKIVKIADSTAKLVNVSSALVDSGRKMYNSVATVTNIFIKDADRRLPTNGFMR